MELSRLMMFDPNTYIQMLYSYNLFIWPAPLVSLVLIGLIFGLFFKSGDINDRITSSFLGGFWIWTGIVFHLLEYSVINLAAPLFGALFILQGSLFFWTGTLRGRLDYSGGCFKDRMRGFSLAVFALAFHPLIAISNGGSWLQAPLAGLAPDATLVFSLGFLGLSKGRPPRHMLIIPGIWCIIATVTAWLIEVPSLWALPLVGWAGFVWLSLKERGVEEF